VNETAGGFWRAPETVPRGKQGRPPPSTRLGAFLRERPLFLHDRQRLIVHLVVFGGIYALLVFFFKPSLVLSRTTDTGGDTAAHIYTAWYLRNHLLPHGLLTGWSPGWYAGFPLLTFYFPLVATFQAVLSYVIPYQIAFKLGTVLGISLLPVAFFLLFRLLRLEFPVPALAAICSLGFLFLHSFTIDGGNIAGSLVGEYSFAVSFALCLIFLGLIYQIATSEWGHPILASVVLALAVLSHVVPVMMVVLLLPIIIFWAIQTHGFARAVVRLGWVLAVAFGLTAIWAIPFVVRIGYSTNMHWQQLDGWKTLFPGEARVYMAGAAVGVALAAARRDRRILLFVGLGLWSVVLYLFLPEGHVWNGRFVPFWFLAVFLCFVYGVGTVLPMLGRLFSRRGAALTATALLAAALIVGVALPIWRQKASFVDDWIKYNYTGYESRPAWPEFRSLMQRVSQLPPGRVMWEPSPDQEKFGSAVALQSLPYWTGRPTMEGIYFESSITTPFHFLTASEVAQRPSNPIPGLPYHAFDLNRGITHMQLMGIRYYITYSALARRAAESSRLLTPMGKVGEFSIFRIPAAPEVVIPPFRPVVLDSPWVESNLKWFSNMSNLEVPLVRDGPSTWAHRSSLRAPLPRVPLAHGGEAISAHTSDDEISFTTDAIGEPTWIKTSYFPNWKAEGALGPYLASPSMMMVIPTQAHVTLKYERTWVEWTGSTLTLLTFIGLALPPIRRRAVALW
jgi:6-pyruvoyl-tetrahydropterin synthase related domain